MWPGIGTWGRMIAFVPFHKYNLKWWLASDLEIIIFEIVIAYIGLTYWESTHPDMRKTFQSFCFFFVFWIVFGCRGPFLPSSFAGIAFHSKEHVGTLNYHAPFSTAYLSYYY